MYLKILNECKKKKNWVRHLQNSNFAKNNPKFQDSASQEAQSTCISYQCYTSAGLEWAMSNLLSLLYIVRSLRLSSDFECDCVCAICFWVLWKLCYLQSYLIGSANLKFQLTTSILRENNSKILGKYLEIMTSYIKFSSYGWEFSSLFGRNKLPSRSNVFAVMKSCFWAVVAQEVEQILSC